MIEWKVKVDKSYEERNTMQMDRAIIEATRKTAELIAEQNEILREILAESKKPDEAKRMKPYGSYP